MRPVRCALWASALYAGFLTLLMIWLAASKPVGTVALIAPLLVFAVTALLSLVAYGIGSIKAPKQTLHAEPQDLQQTVGDQASQETGNPYQPPQ